MNDSFSLDNMIQVPFHMTIVNCEFIITIGFLSLVYETVTNMKCFKRNGEFSCTYMTMYKWRPFHLCTLFLIINNNEVMDMKTTEVKLTPVPAQS
jgi:hypothetical protein